MYLVALYIMLLIVIIYIISLLIYITGNLLYSTHRKSEKLPSISVIIAAKNGEKSLPNILSDLNKQNYQGNYEFIIVDDQSNDNTKNIIKEFEEKNSKFKYISSIEGDSRLFLKKRALDSGIKKSQYDILLFTDVDCRLKSNWIHSMANCFEKNIDYVIGYSEVSSPSNLISWFQKIDLLMMMSAGMATANLNIPFACSGQNQAYKKSLYQKIGFLKINDSIQGDDTLFLQLCLKEKIKTRFNNNNKSFVQSRMEINILSFIKQRMRWAADAKIMWAYSKGYFIIILSTFLTNLLLLLSPIILFLEYDFMIFLYILGLMKLILEFIIYIIGSNKFKTFINPVMFLFWFMVEIPYVVFVGIGSFFIKYIGWKGQKI